MVEGGGVIPDYPSHMMVRTSLMGDCLATSVNIVALPVENIIAISWW